MIQLISMLCNVATQQIWGALVVKKGFLCSHHYKRVNTPFLNTSLFLVGLVLYSIFCFPKNTRGLKQPLQTVPPSISALFHWVKTTNCDLLNYN